MHTADLAPSRISGGELASWRWEFVRLFIFKQKKNDLEGAQKMAMAKKIKKIAFAVLSGFFFGGSKNHSRRFRKPRYDSFFFFLPELLTTKGLYVPSNKENTYGESAT